MEMRLVLLTSTPGFPGGSDSKESAHNVGDTNLIPGLGRSPGERILAWRIPWIEEPGSPWGHKESGTTEQLTHPPAFRGFFQC